MDNYNPSLNSPPSPEPASPTTDRSAPNNNPNVSSHMRTLYQIQNMLRRQLQQARLDGSNPINNTGNNGANVGDHLSIMIDPENNNQENNNDPLNTHTSSARGNNTGESNIATEEVNTGARFDLQLLTKWVEQSFPFIFLLLLIWIYEHRNGMSNNTHNYSIYSNYNLLLYCHKYTQFHQCS